MNFILYNYLMVIFLINESTAHIFKIHKMAILGREHWQFNIDHVIFGSNWIIFMLSSTNLILYVLIIYRREIALLISSLHIPWACREMVVPSSHRRSSTCKQRVFFLLFFFAFLRIHELSLNEAPIL